MTIEPSLPQAVARVGAVLLSWLIWPLRQVLRPLGRAKLVSHRLIGFLVELGGNRVTIEGLRFSVDSTLINRRQKGMLDLGLHETSEIELTRRCVDFSLPVVELGAGIGIVACTVNRRLSRPEDHVVVEANPDLIPLLECNRRLNASQFRIRDVALGYGGDAVELAIDSFVSSRVGGAGRRVLIRTTTLAELLEDAAFERVNLIVDIEGAEIGMVDQEGPLLARRVRALIVETHPLVTGAEPVARMLAQLRTLGFAEVARVRDVFAFEHITPTPPRAR